MINRFRWLIKKIIPVYNSLFDRAKTISGSARQYKSIAYVINGGIGDAVMAYPAIGFLLKSFPESRLTIYVPTFLFPIISNVFSEISVLPIRSLFKVTLKNIILRKGNTLSFVNTTSVFSVVIELLAFFSSKYTYGFRYPDEDRKKRLFSDSRAISESAHFSEQNVKLISETLHLPYDKSDIFLPTKIIKGKDIPTSEIIIHPGSKKGYENKRWPSENYVELIQRLTKKGYTIIILLGPDDDLQKAQFENYTNVQILVKPTITKLVDTFKRAIYFIGNDSGPAHLAAFYGITGVTLFGPESPQRSAPIGKASISIYNGYDCSPCHFKQKACDNNQCMKSITVDQVWNEIERHLLTR